MDFIGRIRRLLSPLKSMIPVLIGVLSPLILIGVVGGVLVLFGKLFNELNKRVPMLG